MIQFDVDATTHSKSQQEISRMKDVLKQPSSGKASNGANKTVNDEKKRKEKSAEANWMKRLDKVSG